MVDRESEWKASPALPSGFAARRHCDAEDDDMNVLVFKKQSTMWRDLPPLQAKYEEDAQREQERRATELHGEISLAKTNVDLTMVRVRSEFRDGRPYRVGACKFSASEMSSTACMSRRGSGVTAFVCFGRFRRRHQRLETDLSEMCLLSYSAHLPEAVATLDLGGCRKFATTGRRCGAAHTNI